ncbi:hypothetical protein FACS189491_02220 [Spirochaetia bacterium]|nr:hypothetical protein FACS189491_02220 [Spirochaetia bacterium]
MTMGTNHGDFSGNTGAFSGVRLGEAANTMGLTNQFTRQMNQTMADVMPKWPDTMNAPDMRQPAQSAPQSALQVQFSVAVNGQASGPYDLNMLSQITAQGQLTAQSLVWRPGMADWQAAGTVPELAGLFAGTGTPPPSPTLPPPAP